VQEAPNKLIGIRAVNEFFNAPHRNSYSRVNVYRSRCTQVETPPGLRQDFASGSSRCRSRTC
jgi:hypothetical protein